MKTSMQLTHDLFVTPADLMEELLSDNLYKQIINSDAFDRLKGISFLGAIDKTHDNRKKIRSTRHQHSLDVALLALYISKKRHYSKEIENIIVTSALLHDIGHAPLSHSMESEFHKKYGIDHHNVSLDIVSGRNTKFRELYNIVNNETDITQVLALINMSSDEEFSDLFCSPINIDTIDGIHKTLKYCSNSDTIFNKYSVASAAFLSSFECNNNESRTAHLDAFWKHKDFVYKNIINSGKGALADYFSKRFFNENDVKEEHFTLSEGSLFNNRKPIFRTFHNTLRSIYIFVSDYEAYRHNSLTHIEFNVINRDYVVDDTQPLSFDLNHSQIESIKNRYICKKKAGRLAVNYGFIDEHENQYSFFGSKK